MSSRLSRPSKIFWRPIWPLRAASSRCRCRVGRNSMVVTKKPHDSQNRFEVAVHLDGSRAVAVAEHAAMHFAAEFPHLSALLVGW